MKQITIIPTEREIKLIKALAEDKKVSDIGKETKLGVGKVYEQISVAKMKYGKRTTAGLVHFFHQIGLLK